MTINDNDVKLMSKVPTKKKVKRENPKSRIQEKKIKKMKSYRKK